MLHHCNIRKRTGTYKLHIRLGINIVLLGGDKGIDTKVEGGVKILIVKLSSSCLGTKFHRIKTVTIGRHEIFFPCAI